MGAGNMTLEAIVKGVSNKIEKAYLITCFLKHQVTEVKCSFEALFYAENIDKALEKAKKHWEDKYPNRSITVESNTIE